ncbi:MAG: hypothetical protein ACI9NT_001638 [Bacteroidia bacterium]|jgi:hypothetical protein
MLSLSAELSQQNVDLAVINGEGNGGVAHGEELMKFAEALASRDEAKLTEARHTLLRVAGAAVLVDAAGVAANFQRMVRIADATGIPVDGMMEVLSSDIQDDLNLRRFHSASNTPTQSGLRKLLNIPLRLLAGRVLKSVDRKARAG